MSGPARARIPWSGVRPTEPDAPRRRGSAHRQVGERLLLVAVPPHRPERSPPTPLHLLVRRLVGRVTCADRLAEVAVLRLDDLVGGLPVQLQVARASQLAARHGLHRASPRGVGRYRTLLMRCSGTDAARALGGGTPLVQRLMPS